MASGSQMCSGNCAALPIVPPKMNSPAVVIQAGHSPPFAATASEVACHSSVKWKVLKW